MVFETAQVDYAGLADALNQIGSVNLYQILTSVEDGATVYTLVYINKTGATIQIEPVE